MGGPRMPRQLHRARRSKFPARSDNVSSVANPAEFVLNIPSKYGMIFPSQTAEPRKSHVKNCRYRHHVGPGVVVDTGFVHGTGP